MLEWLSPHASEMGLFHEDIVSKKYAGVGEGFLSDATARSWMENHSGSPATLLGIGHGEHQTVLTTYRN
jgi:hypothetical protein